MISEEKKEEEENFLSSFCVLSVSVIDTHGRNFYQCLKSSRSISALSVTETDHSVYSESNSCSMKDLHVGIKCFTLKHLYAVVIYS